MARKFSAAAGGAVIGIAAVLLVLIVAGLYLVYSGRYNVAATEEHTSLTRWALSTTMHHSIESRARALMPPDNITADMLAAGAAEYKEACQHCHGGPGADPAEWAEGMRPRPPHLTEAAAEWDVREVFWIVKHGIKMSGMPAFGPTHPDDELWNVAAFVKQLPALTEEEYRGLGGASGHTESN